MSATHCWYCGSDWCDGGDRCNVRYIRQLHSEIDALRRANERLERRVEWWAGIVAGRYK